MTQSLVKQPTTFSNFLSSPAIKNKIAEMVGGEKAQGFITSIVAAVSNNPALGKCDNSTILSAALQGEALNLSPSPVLGHYYMVPYEDRKNNRTVAQWQIGYKGYIQLAIRSGQFKTLNVIELRQGELLSYNPMTEHIVVEMIEDDEARENAPVIGYYAGLEYLNGFRKSIYWSKKKMESHAKQYSKSYANDVVKGTQYTFWSKSFDDMAKKTMLRQLLSRWGLMSIEIEIALAADQAMIEENKLVFVDSEPQQDQEPPQESQEEIF